MPRLSDAGVQLSRTAPLSIAAVSPPGAPGGVVSVVAGTVTRTSAPSGETESVVIETPYVPSLYVWPTASGASAKLGVAGVVSISQLLEGCGIALEFAYRIETPLTAGSLDPKSSK